MMKRSLIITVVLAIIIVGGGIGAYLLRTSPGDDGLLPMKKASVMQEDQLPENRQPEPQLTRTEPSSATAEKEATKPPRQEAIPPTQLQAQETAYLDIPFTPQAPHANWDLPYQEACEEASMMMAARFLQGRTIKDADDADQAILQLVGYGTSLGYPIDTTAEETAATLTSFYGFQTEVIYDFTWNDVKQHVSDGHPVILPAAGRQLENPNFTQPGPLYHMLVVKGYTPDHIITNDPGTKNGLDYTYEYDRLYSAVHDWNGGNVEAGAKVMIAVLPESAEE